MATNTKSRGKHTNLKEFKTATPNKNMEFVENFCPKIYYYEDAFLSFPLRGKCLLSRHNPSLKKKCICFKS